MAKKKSTKLKRSSSDIEKKALVQEEQLSVKTFLKNIWVIIAFILFLSLCIKKISTASDNSIQWTGWLILGVCFALITGLGTWVSPWVERIMGIKEDQAETCTAIILVGIVAAVAFFLWDYIAPFIVSNVK